MPSTIVSVDKVISRKATTGLAWQLSQEVRFNRWLHGH